MRYPVEKIKEALLSPDKETREMALLYFTESYSEDPEVMPLVLQAIEQYGSQASAFYGIGNLVQSDESIQSLVRMIESGVPETTDAGSILQLNRVIRKIDFQLVKPYLERLFECGSLEAESREWLQIQVEMAGWDEAQCLGRLESYIREEVESKSEYYDFIGQKQLLSALAQTGSLQKSSILHALQNSPVRNVEFDLNRQLFLGSYAMLAGYLKIKEAIPFLVDLLEENDDLVQVLSAEALARIGSPEIVSLIGARYATAEQQFKGFAADVIKDIKCDESIPELRRLLQTEADPNEVESLLRALIMQFDPDQMQFIYDRLIADEMDPDYHDIYPDLLAVCDLMEVRFEGYDELNRIVARARLNQLRRQWAWEDSLYKRKLGGKKRPAPEKLIANFKPAPITPKPATRIGRNDPCPCGSGKKFKKCCINKTSL